LKFINSF